MRVCVVGSGAREHALALALAKFATVVVAPGSAVMASRDEPHPITVSAAPPEEIEADLFVIGPEAPLVAGLADALRQKGRLVLGPGADGARLEGSKAYMKELAASAGVPTASFATFTEVSAAIAHLERSGGPYVIKTDGLAAGKGVLVTENLTEAIADVRSKLDGSAFGDAGRTVVIEEYLAGSELSLLVLTDGERAVPLPAAQDFKRVGDGDLGANTGGMGAYAPVSLAEGTVDAIMARIVEPTLVELRRRGIDYRGVLYAGCMLTDEGPRLVEFNVRFGDPETEVVLPLLDDDLADLFARAAAGQLDRAPRSTAGAALCVVLAAEGYPGAPRPGVEIRGLEAAESVDGVQVLHAGTAMVDGRFYSAGGRVLVVRAVGADLAEAHTRCYAAIDEIEFPGAVLRHDIAAGALGAGAGGARMIDRYSLPEMARLHSDVARLSNWLEVELLATEAWSRYGLVPAEYAAAARKEAPVIDEAFVAAVAERERVTDHDVAAFVDVVQEAIGAPAGSWIHYGLTSSDVVDTALSLTLVRSADLLIEAASALIETLRRRAREFATTPTVGRTHGMHAEPTTFGMKLALFGLQVDRDRTRLRRARETVAVGKLSGAVGTYSNIDPQIEADVCAALGLMPVPATQVLSRDRHAEYLYACASVGATIEAIATEIRHLQRSEVAEAEEPFRTGQKGSSAMPHKRNPITAERLVGMARVLRGYLVAGLEDVALWHERDISHSSVERIVLPDSSLLAYYGLVRAERLIGGLVVRTDRMRENLLEGSLGLVFSQPVLLALVEGGCTRDSAYRIVQRTAREAFDSRQPFRSVLERDEELRNALGEGKLEAALDAAFDLERALLHAHFAIDALEEVGP